MAGFVPENKLGKKARKELNRRRRKMWGISPVTQTVDSKKRYNRKRNARDRYDDRITGVSLSNVLRESFSPAAYSAFVTLVMCG